MNSLEQKENELDARESSGDSADAVERDDGIPVSGEPETGETGLDTPDSAGMNDDEPGDGASVAVNDSQCEDRHSRVLPRIGIAAACIFIVFGFILFFTEIWLFKTWESLSPDELLFHLQVPLAGTNTSMITDYLNEYGSIELFLLTLIFVLLFAFRKHRIAFRTIMGASLTVSLALCAYAFFDFAKQVRLAEYLVISADEAERADFTAENYVDSGMVSLDFPQIKRNVVYIFLESMEVTYADELAGGAFPHNVIPELTRLALANECFNGNTRQLNGCISYSGSTWTMGAMFAQSTGLPLKGTSVGNESAARYDTFFEGLTGLGDILKDQGYRQVLLIGSTAAFGGREAFYNTHGQFEIRDYDYAAQAGLIPEGHRVFWGYEDLYLFDIAKQTLVELAASGQPFNLTLLTVDTHFEDGYVCELCGSDYADDQYSNVMACSSRQVSEFVTWLQQQDFYENTVIVICGDHPTMDKDYCQDVPEEYLRKTYTCIINAAVEPVDPGLVREYSTMDMFPTTLAAMGVQIEGERLGLGTNLFSDMPTLTEELGYDTCSRRLDRASSFLSDTYTLGNSASYLEKIAGQVYADANVYPTGTAFVLGGLRGINYEAIRRVDAVITDSRTGESIERQVLGLRHNVGGEQYSFELRTEYTEEDLPFLQVEFLITVEGTERYPIAIWKAESPESQ